MSVCRQATRVLAPLGRRKLAVPPHDHFAHQLPIPFQHASFASAAPINGARHKKRNAEDPDLPLMNEKLVERIRRSKPNVKPEQIEVRVIERTGPPQVVSLTHAIEASVQQKLDLLAVSIDKQEIPVIRLDHLHSFKKQQKAKIQSQKNNQKMKDKEIRFHNRIQRNDMERKVQQVCQFVDKGHQCLVKMPQLLSEEIMKLFPQHIEPMQAPKQVNNLVTVRVHSTRKK